MTESAHHVFWMGDMNYRTTFSDKTPTSKRISNELQPKEEVDSKMVELLVDKDKPQDLLEAEETDESDEEVDTSNERTSQMKTVLDMIVREQWSDILLLDELNRELLAKRVLNGFTALQPSFPPTFKRVRHLSIAPRDSNLNESGVSLMGGRKWSLGRHALHSNNSEKTESPITSPEPEQLPWVQEYYDKKRIPSFTDRVLYKSNQLQQANLSPKFFQSCELTDRYH